jgi:DNA polymerase III subunit gamma/tau
MAYKALYRIYRPQTFDEVVGQKYILQTIKNAINNNKIAHAYLFSGPRGTGKTTLAKLLAKGVNCTSDKIRPCNECDNCKSIALGNNPDVIEIDAASNNGVEEIRDIIDKVKYAPISGKYKIYIIDEVHMLSTGAFNALLKTLEEPPAHVIFVLATTEIHKVLPTIISRCQRFDFNKVSQSDIKLRIKEILDKENISYNSEVVSLIAELADGGVRDALGILDQTIAYAGNNLTSEHVRDIYGVLSTAEILQLIETILRQDTKAIIMKLNEYDLQGIDLVKLTYGMLNVVKEIVLFNHHHDASSLELLSLEQAEISGSKISDSFAFKMIDLFVETIANFKKVSSAKTLLEITFLKLANEEVKVAQPVIITPLKQTATPEPPKEIVTINKKQEIPEPSSSTKETDLTNDDEDNTNTPSEVKSEEEAKKKNKEQTILFTDKDLMNVLVQATKEDKEFVQGRWNLISNYMTKPQFQVAASLVIDGVPFAAGSNAMILGYQLAPQAKAANKVSNYKLIISFLNELFGKEMIIYSITDEYFRAIRLDYINRKSLNNLPAAEAIEMPEFVEIKEEEVVDLETEKAVELGLAIFGEKLKIKE